MATHFSSDSPHSTEAKKYHIDLLSDNETYLSVYENINISNEDTHRGSFYPKQDSSENNIIVVDVEPYDDGSIAKEAALDDFRALQFKQAQEAQTEA